VGPNVEAVCVCVAAELPFSEPYICLARGAPITVWPTHDECTLGDMERDCRQTCIGRQTAASHCGVSGGATSIRWKLTPLGGKTHESCPPRAEPQAYINTSRSPVIYIYLFI